MSTEYTYLRTICRGRALGSAHRNLVACAAQPLRGCLGGGRPDNVTVPPHAVMEALLPRQTGDYKCRPGACTIALTRGSSARAFVLFSHSCSLYNSLLAPVIFTAKAEEEEEEMLLVYCDTKSFCTRLPDARALDVIRKEKAAV